MTQIRNAGDLGYCVALPDSGDAKNRSIYASPFTDWDRRASVRTKPRQQVEAPATDKVFFPPEFVPVCRHPLVRRVGPQAEREILAHALFLYLDFTSVLEHEIVNKVSQRVAGGTLDVPLPEPMRFDAYRIYCDEGYHALFSVDLRRQIEELTNLHAIPNHTAPFIRGFREMSSRLPEDVLPFAEAFCAVVSETLITKSISQIPNDPQVHDVVRRVVSHHAQDEAYHSLYFVRLLDRVWPVLGASRQRLIGQLLPRMIREFLEPDRAALHRVLVERVGLGEAEARRVIAESYPRRDLDRGLRHMARGTLSAFHRAGVFSVPCVADAFDKAGLLDLS